MIPNPNILPTDVLPMSLSGEREVLSREFRYKILRALPEKMWFNSTTEVSQRLDTNVFMTYSKPRADYVFRVLPNVSLGYNILPRTSVYCNYFIVKDVFAHNTVLNQPTTQSLSLGFRQDFKPIANKLTAQLDFQARELWQASHLRQADLLPALNLTYFVNRNVILFGSTLLQMRSKNYFQGPTREIDPFYTVGALYRKGDWNFLATDTLVTNFRFKDAVPSQSNCTMVADFEVSRPVNKRVKGLVAFVRAEPVYNWNSNKVGGLSGFDFRLFGGLRLALSKPSYAADINMIRDQIKRQEQQKKQTPNQ